MRSDVTTKTLNTAGLLELQGEVQGRNRNTSWRQRVRSMLMFAWPGVQQEKEWWMLRHRPGN